MRRFYDELSVILPEAKNLEAKNQYAEESLAEGQKRSEALDNVPKPFPQTKPTCFQTSCCVRKWIVLMA